MADERSGPLEAPASLDLARRALARVGDGAHSAELLQRGCDHITQSLQESLGDAGCTALLARALVRTEARYPLLVEVRRLERGTIELSGVAASVSTHGLPAVTTAVEVLVAALFEILTQLIGADMARRLIDHEERHHGAPEGEQKP